MSPCVLVLSVEANELTKNMSLHELLINILWSFLKADSIISLFEVELVSFLLIVRVWEV